METEKLNEFLYNYLRLCDAFKNCSEFWKNQTTSQILDENNSSTYLLCIPLQRASELLKERNNVDNTIYNKIFIIADDIWTATQNRNDIKLSVTTEVVDIDNGIIDSLMDFYNPGMCRANCNFLVAINNHVYDLLYPLVPDDLKQSIKKF